MELLVGFHCTYICNEGNWTHTVHVYMHVINEKHYFVFVCTNYYTISIFTGVRNEYTGSCHMYSALEIATHSSSGLPHNGYQVFTLLSLLCLM